MRALVLGLCLMCGVAEAAQLPSLFRGVVVADSPVGVRVVTVEEQSQAGQADLRPDDVIVRINNHDVHSIDEFAVMSKTLRGRTTSSSVLVFRGGKPVELRVHLFSYPILQAWGIEFLADQDIRFAEPKVGLEYWRRLGNGFDIANDTDKALNAYLNALHNVPDHVDTAVKASQLLCKVSQRQFSQRQLTQGTTSLQNAVRLMEKLFDYPLTDDQLQGLKQQLRDTLQALKAASARAS